MADPHRRVTPNLVRRPVLRPCAARAKPNDPPEVAYVSVSAPPPSPASQTRSPALPPAPARTPTPARLRPQLVDRYYSQLDPDGIGPQRARFGGSSHLHPPALEADLERRLRPG